MNPALVDARFVSADGVELLVTRRLPARHRVRDSVMVVPAFAEEMNKSRPLLRDLGEQVAEDGRVFIVPDLSGTGDSQGEFRDASVARWTRDLDHVCAWAERCGHPVGQLVCIRSGGLLAQKWVQSFDRQFSLSLFLQPVILGSDMLKEWLRTRVAASIFGNGPRETIADLENRLSCGESVEVGGYCLSAAMANEFNALNLDSLPGSLGMVRFIETGPGGEVSARLLELAKASGSRARTARIAGEPFWRATEIVRSPDLVSACAAALLSA